MATCHSPIALQIIDFFAHNRSNVAVVYERKSPVDKAAKVGGSNPSEGEVFVFFSLIACLQFD